MNASTSKVSDESCRIEKKFTYKWLLDDFKCHKTRSGATLPSKKFEFDFGPQAKFCGKLYIRGDECKQRKCCLKLESINLSNWKSSSYLWLGPSIIYNYGFDALSNESNRICWKLYNKSGCLLNQYFCGNVLTLTLVLSYVPYKEQTCSTLSEIDAIADLYVSKKDWDVTFVVKGYELHGHRSVLAERSNAFATMFARQMDKWNKVNVTDVDVEAFNEMLRFLYTGKVATVTLKLLTASIKYDLPQLRTICENDLMLNMCNETAAETLVIASIYDVKHLKECALKYIKDNLAAVIETEGWYKYVKNYHSLFAEIWK